MKPEQLESIVSHRIRDLRLLRGMTQQDLAEAIGVHAPHISDLERGIKSPTVGTLAKLAEALDVEPEALLSENCQMVA